MPIKLVLRKPTLVPPLKSELSMSGAIEQLAVHIPSGAFRSAAVDITGFEDRFRHEPFVVYGAKLR